MSVRRLDVRDADTLRCFALEDVVTRHEVVWAASRLADVPAWGAWIDTRLDAVVVVGLWGASWFGSSESLRVMHEQLREHVDPLMMWVVPTADGKQLDLASADRRVYEQSMMVASDVARVDSPAVPHIGDIDHTDFITSCRTKTYADEFGIRIQPFSPRDSELIGFVAGGLAAGVVVVELDDGRIVFTGEQSATSTEAVAVYSIYVDPVFRRRGYARTRMAGWMRELLVESERIVLRVNSDNAPAISLYRDLGFEHHAEFTCAVRAGG